MLWERQSSNTAKVQNWHHPAGCECRVHTRAGARAHLASRADGGNIKGRVGRPPVHRPTDPRRDCYSTPRPRPLAPRPVLQIPITKSKLQVIGASKRDTRSLSAATGTKVLWRCMAAARRMVPRVHSQQASGGQLRHGFQFPPSSSFGPPLDSTEVTAAGSCAAAWALTTPRSCRSHRSCPYRPCCSSSRPRPKNTTPALRPREWPKAGAEGALKTAGRQKRPSDLVNGWEVGRRVGGGRAGAEGSCRRARVPLAERSIPTTYEAFGKPGVLWAIVASHTTRLTQYTTRFIHFSGAPVGTAGDAAGVAGAAGVPTHRGKKQCRHRSHLYWGHEQSEAGWGGGGRVGGGGGGRSAGVGLCSSGLGGGGG